MKKRTRGNGEGSVYRLKTGLWCAAYVVGRRVDGGIDRRYWYSRLRSDVVKALNEARSTARAGGTMRLAEWLPLYLKRHAAEVDAITITNADRIFRQHVIPKMGRLPLESVTPGTILNWQADLLASGLKPRTVSTIRGHFAGALRAAWMEGLIAENPCAKTKAPKITKREPTVWDQTQAQAWLKHIHGHPMEALFTLAICCGIRKGELIGLRREDYSGETLEIRRQRQHGQIKAPKRAASYRTIVLPDLCREALDRHLATTGIQSGWLFLSSHGTPYSEAAISKVWIDLLTSSGLPKIRMHDLRHSAASILRAAGAPMAAIQQLLGHSSYHTTVSTYAHPLPQEAHDTAAKSQSTFAPTAVSTAARRKPKR